jgi:hypothetical protein
MITHRAILVIALGAFTAAASGGEQRSIVIRNDAPDVKLSGNARIDFSALREFPAIFQEGSPDASAA